MRASPRHQRRAHPHAPPSVASFPRPCPPGSARPAIAACSPALPEQAAQLIKTVTFHDGFVSWTAVDNGGFGEDGVTPLMPECLHSVDSAVGVEFREYLIELK